MGKTYLNYNDCDLTEYVDIYHYNNPLLPERENRSVDIPSMNGLLYKGFKYKSRPIELGFDVKSKDDVQLKERLDIIAKAFDVNEPAKLYVEDTDKYFWAIPKNNIDKEKLCKGYAEIEVDLICYDPHMYSDEIKLFEGNSDNIVTIENSGSAEAYPSVNVAVNNEAHFIQITNYEGKTILLGDRPSIDNESVNPISYTLSDPCEDTTNWLPAGNVVDANRVVDGNVAISANGNYITGSNYGATDSTWHGPAVRRNLGKNMRDFELRATMIFKAKYASTNGSGYSKFTPGTYANNEWALMMRESSSLTSKVLQTIPYGTKIYLSKINSSGSWGYCTYNKISGWVKTEYLIKVSSKNIKGKSGVNLLATDTPSDNGKVENKMGRLELYGFDSNGQKLFKVVLRDSTFWYEYVDPEVWIGNTLILEDKKNCPSPKTKKKKDGDKTVMTAIESGKFGAWNSFYGEVLVRRETIKNKQYWALQLNKLVGGRVVQTLRTTMRLTNTNYPKGDLNNIVIWFGQHEDKPVPDEMGLTHLKVMELNSVSEKADIINFYPGDEVTIDCGNGEILLNGFDCIEKCDIGSEFFECPPGNSQFIVNSDDVEVYTSATIQERWRNS